MKFYFQRGEKMKILKKINILILTILLISSARSSEAVWASDDTEPVIEVKNQNGNIGEEVNVDVIIGNNPGIAGATLQVEYDSKLILEKADNGDAFSELTFTKPEQFNNPVRFLWDSEKGKAEQDGILLELQFLISDQAVVGDQLAIHISYVEGDIYNEKLEDVQLQLNDGIISVGKEESCERDGHKYESVPRKIEGTEIIPAKNECLKKGSYDVAIFCERCGEYDPETVQTIYMDAKGHVPMEPALENEILPTHESEGSYDVVVRCQNCGEVISSETVQTDKIEHVPAAEVKENEIPATCSREGSYDEVIYCTECKAEISRTKVKVKKQEHKEVIDKAIAPTYTKNGLTQGSHCAVCNTVLVKQKTIAKLTKKNPTISVAKKTLTFTAAKLKKSKQTFKISAKVTGNGKLTYKKVSGSSKLSVSKSGTVTIKKGTKKGTYKICVQIKAKESSKYKAKTQKVTITVKVK